MAGSFYSDIFDRVGDWTILKHDIVQYYAETYSKIMTRSRGSIPNFTYYYMAARTSAIDVLIHFPIYSMNINVLHSAGAKQKERLNAYWGDGSWEPIVYEDDPQTSLFGEGRVVKAGNEKIVSAYRDRLLTVAGFKATSAAIPMRNSKGNIVYYLIFATSNERTGAKAIQQVANHFIKLIESGKWRRMETGEVNHGRQ